MKTLPLNLFCIVAALGFIATGCSNEKSAAPVAPAASAAAPVAAPAGNNFADPSKLTEKAPE
ncbi:MAG: hypothetical protein RL616_2123, partial [Verrucomicrobiota bacterium]